MSLHLDARQRAMLQEMGVALFAPPQRPVPRPAAAPEAASAPAPLAPSEPTPAAAPFPAAPAPEPPPARAAAAPLPPAPPAAVPEPPATAPHASPAAALLAAPHAPYAPAGAAATGPGGGWLVVLECALPEDPMAGEAGRLLDNMLRALWLHRDPATHVAALVRPMPGLPAQPEGDAVLALPQVLQQLRPQMVLLLGLGAARAALGSRAPLARLRADVHRLAGGIPAVVSYDPAYLLRAPEAKAAAWADLCRARAVVRAAQAPSPPGPAAPH